ncbi:MAG: hypothetical protein M1820_010703 [Bogoriella megaspora]|nr:MAG: hypothetical protein M1820_010703 [Bogoriella megaspora]
MDPSGSPTQAQQEVTNGRHTPIMQEKSTAADSATEESSQISEMDIDPENEVKGLRLLIVHTGICLCTFLVGLDFNLIATAIPVITTQFDSINDVAWYGAAFYIVLCATQPLAGKMYTLFPKKLVYLVYLVVFEAGSLVCALAPTSNALIAGRAVAGLGASGVFAGGFVLLTSIIPLHKRAIYTATMSSTFAIASIIGPVIAGAFTTHVTWRWCFYINLPIGGFAAGLIFFIFKLRPAATENEALAKKLKGLDIVGFLLFAASVVMLLLALQFGGAKYAWNSSQVVGLFVGSGVTMLAFVPWQLYLQDTALVTPRIFKNRNAILIFVAAVFVNGPFQLIIYWLPIWFQAVLGASAESSGIRYLPTVISDALASVIGAGLAMQLGFWNPFLLFGYAMVCLGGGLLTTIHPGISDGHWIGYQIFGGIGYSLASNMAHLGLQASLPTDLVPIGSTTVLFIMSAACAIFLSIGQAIFDHRLITELAKVVPRDIVAEVVSVGATNVRSIVSGQGLDMVLRAYSDAITQIWYIPAVAPAISFLLLLAARWTSLKKTKTESQVSENSVGQTRSEEEA